MIEEEAVARTRDGEAMLYDHYKHLTSLCLFSLAGGVALADKAQGRWAVMLVVALVMIGAAAMVSAVSAGQLVEARLDGKPFDRKGLVRAAPGALLSTGIGILLYVFTRSLKL